MTMSGISNNNPNGSVKFIMNLKYFSAVNIVSKCPLDKDNKKLRTIGYTTKYPNDSPVINIVNNPGM